MKTKYFILIISLLILIFPLINAETSGGELKGTKGDCINLPQECADCSYVKLTTITLPNLNKISIQTNMIKDGTSFSYNFCNTNDTGDYIYCTLGDVGGVDTIACKNFAITPSGSIISTGGGFGLFASMFVILVIGVIFLTIAIRSDKFLVKFAFYLGSIIVFIILILYTIIIIQQTLFGFESILAGIENFWFVIKMFLSAGIIVFIVIIFLVLLKYFRIKRGFYD